MDRPRQSSYIVSFWGFCTKPGQLWEWAYTQTSAFTSRDLGDAKPFCEVLRGYRLPQCWLEQMSPYICFCIWGLGSLRHFVRFEREMVIHRTQTQGKSLGSTRKAPFWDRWSPKECSFIPEVSLETSGFNLWKLAPCSPIPVDYI